MSREQKPAKLVEDAGGAEETGRDPVLLPYVFDRPPLRSIRLLLLLGVIVGGVMAVRDPGLLENAPPWVPAVLIGYLVLLAMAWSAGWVWEYVPDLEHHRPRLAVIGLHLPGFGDWSPGVSAVSVTGVARGQGSARNVRTVWSYLPVVVEANGNQFTLSVARTSLEEANLSAGKMAHAFGVEFFPGQHQCNLVTQRFFGLGGPCKPYQRPYGLHPVNLLIYLFCFLILLRLFLLMAFGIKIP